RLGQVDETPDARRLGASTRLASRASHCGPELRAAACRPTHLWRMTSVASRGWVLAGAPGSAGCCPTDAGALGARVTAAGNRRSAERDVEALLPQSVALSSERAIASPRHTSYSSPDRFIMVGAVALPFSKLRAYCNCLSFSGSLGTYD